MFIVKLSNLLGAARQWVASPLCLNILLSTFKHEKLVIEKYLQVAKLLKETRLCSFKTKLFISSTSTFKDNITNSMNISHIEETDFTKKDNAFNLWASTNGEFKVVTNKTSSTTEFVLANLTLFQTNWSSNKDSGPEMKIYNSFNYTQDVKYEPRLLELPLCGDMKLVVVIPNEVDVLQSLFGTLTSHGLDDAVSSIQPVFATTCELNAPNINVTSTVVCEEKTNAFANSPIVQYGSLFVNKQGINIKILTYMCSPSDSPDTAEQHQGTEKPFYLAVLYNNIPLFTGQFTQ